MASRIIALSGRIASGKSELAMGLERRFGVARLRTRELLLGELGSRGDRGDLQAAGSTLDKKTRGEWVASAVGKEARSLVDDAVIVVDSVRQKSQIDALRRGFGRRVVHVHLTAPEKVLRKRFSARSRKEKQSFRTASADPIEKRVNGLARFADVVIDTDRTEPGDVVIRVAGRLGFFGRSFEPLVDALVGGQWGSEGKGQVAAYLAPEYSVLVRVGGPNAGHQVYGDPKRTFYHLPSGTLTNQDAKIVLGPGAVLWLPRLEEEIADCRLTRDRLFIDPRAMMIEGSDRELEESGGLVKGIGSTGQGVGVATSRKALRNLAEPKVRLAQDEKKLRDYIRETAEVLDDAYMRGERVFLEGTQGTGLSLHHGTYPYVTSRDTTVGGCMADAGIPPARIRRTVMVCRSYPIRVGGKSGPMGKEIDFQTVADRSGLPAEELVKAEKTSTTKRNRRVAEFNWNLLRRAASLNGPTDIALTFADYFTKSNRDARRYESLSLDTREFIEELEQVACAPVSLVAVRFHYRSIIDRRIW